MNISSGLQSVINEKSSRKRYSSEYQHRIQKSSSDLAEHSALSVCDVYLKVKLSTLRERKVQETVPFMATGYNQN